MERGVPCRFVLNGDRSGDMRVRVILLEGEILGLIVEQTLAAVPDHQRGKALGSRDSCSRACSR